MYGKKLPLTTKHEQTSGGKAYASSKPPGLSKSASASSVRSVLVAGQKSQLSSKVTATSGRPSYH